MPTYRGLILQPTHRVRGGRPVVQLHGRLESGEPFLVEDDRFSPYFFVLDRDAKKVAELPDVEVRPSELRDLHGRPVERVMFRDPGAARALRQRLAEDGIPTFESDIRFVYRYLMDHVLRTAVAIEGQPTRGPQGLLHFRNPELSGTLCDAELTHLSIDFETTPDATEIYSVALVGCGVEEVHLVTQTPVRGAVAHANEASLLTTLAARIRELDPDLFLGWNVIDFDLRVYDRRCRALGLPAREVALGRLPGGIDFQSDPGFTRQSRAGVSGRMVVDGIALVRDALRLDDYRLETVARAVLGKGKLIDKQVPDAAAEITRLYREEPEALVAYNLEDARLVPEILEHEGLLDLARERSLLTGMQLDRVGASIASFDLLYLPELRRSGHVAPSVDSERTHQPIKGGAVLSTEPGVVRQVAIYDFKSLYPSLMQTFNLDPLALARAASEPPGATIVAPNGAHLSRNEALLPEIIDRFMAQREIARDRGDRHAVQAIKIMMNSMFGIFAAPSCRFFSPDLANAITGFGQQTLAWTCEAFERTGVRILYGDTDSVFVHLGDDVKGASAQSRAESLRESVAAEITSRIEREYDVEAKLHLELEKIFDRFFLPRTRGGAGSKKRYAGWIEEAEEPLEIVGLESIRRDWPPVTERLQTGMLRRLFRDEEVLPFVREVVDAVRSGELDAELVYTKRIRKESVDRYTASSPPHVKAARKLEARLGRRVGRVIRYVMTRDGPEPWLPDTPLPPGIDHRHYVDRVLAPVAETIVAELGQSFGEALGEPQQLPLL